jgi:hypothetical protein
MPSVLELSTTKQYVPAVRTTALTSNSTVSFARTVPSEASIAPSIAGRVFQVTLVSLQAQLLIAQMRPPASLPALVAPSARRRSRADAIDVTPLARSRNKACFAAGPASTSRMVPVPLFVLGLPASTVASASTSPRGGAGGHVQSVRHWPGQAASLAPSHCSPHPASTVPLPQAGPPAHTPPPHASPTVQGLPSEQEAVFSTWPHPVAGWQASSVHGL